MGQIWGTRQREPRCFWQLRAPTAAGWVTAWRASGCDSLVLAVERRSWPCSTHPHGSTQGRAWSAPRPRHGWRVMRMELHPKSLCASPPQLSLSSLSAPDCGPGSALIARFPRLTALPRCRMSPLWQLSSWQGAASQAPSSPHSRLSQKQMPRVCWRPGGTGGSHGGQNTPAGVHPRAAEPRRFLSPALLGQPDAKGSSSPGGSSSG